MFDVCNYCYKKLTTSGCINCETYKVKYATLELQDNIKNTKYKQPIIVINKNYKYITQYINFKGIKYKFTGVLPDDVIACMVDKDTLDYRRFYENKY